MERQYENHFSLIATTLISGCGPIYETEYQYAEPQGSMAAICINQCHSLKNDHTNRCLQAEQTCRHDEEENAQFAYGVYTANQINQKQPIEKTKQDLPIILTVGLPKATVSGASHLTIMTAMSAVEAKYSRKVCVAFVINNNRSATV